MEQLYCYKGYAYLNGKQLNSTPIYLETRANSLSKARSNVKYRIKNWLALYHYHSIQIDEENVKAISEEEHVDMGNKKIILATM